MAINPIVQAANPNTLFSFSNTSNATDPNFVTMTIVSNPTNFWTNAKGDSAWQNSTAPTNWSTGVVPNAAGKIVTFDDGHYSGPQNVNLGGVVTVGIVNFNSTPTVTLSSGQLNLDNSGSAAVISDTKGTHTIAVPLGDGPAGVNIGVTNAGDSLNFSGGVSINGPIGASGAGTITFSGSIGNASALQRRRPRHSGSQRRQHRNERKYHRLRRNSSTQAYQCPLNQQPRSHRYRQRLPSRRGVGTEHNAAAITTGNIVLQDTATPTPGPVTLALGITGDVFTYSGALSGPGSLTLNNGTMTLTGVSNISGNVTINGGNLIVGAANAYTATNTAVGPNTTLTISPGDSFTGPATLNGNSTFNFVGTGTSTFPDNNIALSATAVSGNPAILISSGSEASEYGGVITFNASGTSVIALEDSTSPTNTVAISLNSSTTNFAGTGTALIPAGDAVRFTNGGGTATNALPFGVTFDVDGSSLTRTGNYRCAGIVMGALTDVTVPKGNLGGQTNTPGVANLYTVGGFPANPRPSWRHSLPMPLMEEPTAVAGGTTALTVVGGTLTLTGASTNTGPMTVNGAGAALVLDYVGSLATNTFAATAGTLRINGAIANPAAVLNASGTGTIIVGNNNDNPNGSPTGAPSPRNVGSVVVGTGGTVALANSVNGQTNRNLLIVGSPTTAGVTTFSGGTLDMGTNDMIIKEAGSTTGGGTELTTLNAAASTALNGSGGIWTGPGLTSSAAQSANNPRRNTGLGIVVNDTNQSGSVSGTPLFTTFAGQPVADGDVLVKYTYFGDALLTGHVNSADYIQIDNGFNSGGTLKGWYNGDFNYDGVINGDDYALIDNAYNTQGTAFPTISSAGPAEMIATNTDQIAGASSSSVPEPTTLGMLGIGAAGLMMRRRRKHA